MTTITRAIPRPGGRSARVQAAVHRATTELLARDGRAALTVPLIAARAGVTPSTIYRRWGELADLPADAGRGAGYLQAWVEQYRDEMSSAVGLGMMVDVLSARGGAGAPGRPPVP